jgi:ubiquinone/menaquinone biosynthesis C-methylase UbiE
MTWENYWKSESLLRISIEKFRDVYFARMISKLVKKHSNVKVLEAGCGTGKSLKFFEKSVGIDNSKEAIKIARNYCKNLVIGDIFKLPFKENSFDMIFNQGVMEHFNSFEFDEILKEFKRVGRKVLIFVPSNTSLFRIVNPFKEFNKFFSKQELKTLISKQYKFVKVRYLPESFFISVMGYGER